MAGAVLSSSFTDDYLAFRSIERFKDGSGYKVAVELQSGMFAAMYPFYVEVEPTNSFLKALSTLDIALTGEAILKPTWEPQFIRIVAGEAGHVAVGGELMEHGANMQLLRFGFRSDQSCVGLFLRDLRNEMSAPDF